MDICLIQKCPGQGREGIFFDWLVRLYFFPGMSSLVNVLHVVADPYQLAFLTRYLVSFHSHHLVVDGAAI